MHAGSVVFHQIVLLIALATLVGVVGKLLRQPMVAAFIAAGILAGPDVLDLMRPREAVELFSRIAIAVLLFLVGLKLDLGLIRSLGRVALVTGLGQIGLTTLIGFLLCLALGLDWLTSLYASVALTFSSTIIIVKLLSDKREIESLHGKIALGILIVQDLFVVLTMVVISAFSLEPSDAGDIFDQFAASVLGASALLGVVAIFMRYLADRVVRLVASSSELLVIFAVGWASGLAAMGEVVGLSKELGGLLAGISLASTSARDIISARLTSLRDFLLLFFFLSLGATVDLDAIGSHLALAGILSLFVLVGKPLIVLPLMGYIGYRRRTGFLTGLTMAQISEFSLIFMAMGVSLGHIPAQAMGLLTLVALITITVSVYMISWSHHLYALSKRFFRIFERRHPFREKGEYLPGTALRRHDVIILGLGRYGLRIAEELVALGFRPLGVDFNPEAVQAAARRGIDVLLGDASDPEFLAHLPIAGVRLVISATTRHAGPLDELDPHTVVIRTLRGLGHRIAIAVTVEDEALQSQYRAIGANLVLCPFADAASEAGRRLAEFLTQPDLRAEPAA